MKRREFITLVSGVAAAWPLAARGQQAGQQRRISVLTGSSDHAEARSRLAAFMDGFRQLGWVDGQNVRIDIRWGSDPQSLVTQAREIVRLKPDAILAGPSNAVIALQRETNTIPVVFVTVSDPVGQGIVDSLSRPRGNVTGFSSLEFSLVGKWIELLKKAAPSITQIGLMISTGNAVSPRWYETFKEVAPTFSAEPITMPVRDPAEIEKFVKSIARTSNSGLIVAGDTLLSAPSIRRSLIELTAAHRVPTIYGDLFFAPEGGLMSYGIDRVDPYRRAAIYIDRILKGEKPSDLPVQRPTRFHFTINLKTAKALGLELPPTLVATADEVID